jgi:hypothetical protein
VAFPSCEVKMLVLTSPRVHTTLLVLYKVWFMTILRSRLALATSVRVCFTLTLHGSRESDLGVRLGSRQNWRSSWESVSPWDDTELLAGRSGVPEQTTLLTAVDRFRAESCTGSPCLRLYGCGDSQIPGGLCVRVDGGRNPPASARQCHGSSDCSMDTATIPQGHSQRPPLPLGNP